MELLSPILSKIETHRRFLLKKTIETITLCSSDTCFPTVLKICQERKCEKNLAF